MLKKVSVKTGWAPCALRKDLASSRSRIESKVIRCSSSKAALE